MSTKSSTTVEASLASVIAPEDLRCGEFVSLLNETVEFPSFYWVDNITCRPEELVRIRRCSPGAGAPLKIEAICLPFVFVKAADQATQTLDLRRVQLVRLKKSYAKTVWQQLRQQTKGKRPTPDV